MHTGIGVNAGMRVNMGSQVLQGPQLLLVGVALLAAALVLQVFLSRRKSRWPGLILPGICVLISLIAVLGVAAFGSLAESILTVLLVLVLYNLPTAVLLAIYAACRSGRRKRDEADTMRIHDL